MKSIRTLLIVLFLSGNAASAMTDSEISALVRNKSGKWMVTEQKARKLTDNKHFDEAAALYQSVMKERHELGLDLQTEELALADIYEKAHKPDLAEATLKKAISERESIYSEDPTLVYTLQTYSDLLTRLKKPAEAAAIKKRILYINSQGNKPPKELSTQLNASQPKSVQAGEAVKIGQLYLKRDQEKRALFAFNKAIELDPHNSEAFEGRGEVFNRTEQEAKARVDFDKAIAINPKIVQALFHRALQLRTRNNDKAALADFNQAIAAAPDNTDILGYRGKLYQDQHHNALAIKDYSHVLELDSHAEWARCQRGLCYMDAKEYTKASADFSYLAQNYPDDSNYLDLKKKADSKAKK